MPESSQIKRQAEPWPAMRHTGVMHEGVMEGVDDAMSCERTNHKPQVALESGHGVSEATDPAPPDDPFKGNS